MDAEVLIVGAGPAGCSTALHLVRRDPSWADRVVMIDRAEFPRDKVCGGGITYFGYRILEGLGLEEPSCYPANEARVHYRRQSFSFAGEPTIRIVPRDVFDHWMLGHVHEAGVDVRQGVNLESLSIGSDGVEAVTDSGVLRAAVVVGADGSLSRVRRSLQWPDPLPLARTLEIVEPVDPDQDPEYRDNTMAFDFSAVTSHRLQGYTWDFPTASTDGPRSTAASSTRGCGRSGPAPGSRRCWARRRRAAAATFSITRSRALPSAGGTAVHRSRHGGSSWPVTLPEPTRSSVRASPLP